MKKDPRDVPSPLYGVTIDDVNKLDDIKASLSKLPHQATARIVFDTGVPAKFYQKSIDELSQVSYVMGELLDSFDVKKLSLTAYQKRTEEYFKELGDKVDIWEVGNEVNGEWLGKTSDVIAKIASAYDYIKTNHGKTALTLYYNEGCAEKPDHEMFTWVRKNIPQSMKAGLDYVLISYYPDDCKGPKPDWQKVFTQLHQLFPQSKIGFGETGTKYKKQKADFIQQFYNLKINVPNYVGGYFWWYFKQDMVPATKPLWQNISLAFEQEHNNFKS